MAGRADDLTLTVSPAPTFLVCYPFRSSEWLAELWLAGCSSEGHVPITNYLPRTFAIQSLDEPNVAGVSARIGPMKAGAGSTAGQAQSA